MKSAKTVSQNKFGCLFAVAFGLLSIAAAHGQFYIAQEGDNTIAEYDTSGALLSNPFISSLGATPKGLIVSGGNLLVSLYAAPGGSVGAYDPSTGAVVSVPFFATPDGPSGIVESGGFLYVANSLSGSVSKYTTAGDLVNDSLITGLSGPVGIAVSGGNLFVSSSDGTVGKYTTAGDTVNASLVTGLGGAGPVVVIGGNLFVATGGSSGVVGEYDTTSGTAVNDSLITGLNVPNGIAVSGDGSYLFITSRDDGIVGEYSTLGDTVNASFITGLNGPGAIFLVVPEPSSMAMLMLGLGLLTYGCRRVRRAII